jgi:hypothetical protein
MQHFKASRTISLLFVFALITFGCATSKNHAATAAFGLTAEAVPEGILLTFSNIPSDATHLWIGVSSLGDTEKPESPHSFIYSFAGITDTSVRGWVHSSRQLDKIKQTGKVIFPIVQTGIKYSISAIVYNELEFYLIRETDRNIHPRTAETELIADNGIYFNRDDVRLEINDAHSVVTISCEPVFSSEVIFDDQKYSFGVHIRVDNNRSIGVGDHHIPDGLSSDGLTWAFEPQMTGDLRRYNDNGWLEIGSNYAAWATANVNIIYDDIKWSVEIAKTALFTFTF